SPLVAMSGSRGPPPSRPWRANAGALVIWENRPSRSRSRHETFVPTFVIETFIRTRRRDHRGISFLRFLRDRISRLLLHSRFARLRAGSGLWRLSFALCMRLLIGACLLLRFLLWLSRLLLRLTRGPGLRPGFWWGSARRCHREMFRLGGRRLGLRRGWLDRRLIVRHCSLILALNSEQIAYEATDAA